MKKKSTHLVVLKVDVRPVDALLLIHALLARKHVGVELLLQLFIREVDAELLEAVLLEALEAVDVQNADASLVWRLWSDSE